MHSSGEDGGGGGGHEQTYDSDLYNDPAYDSFGSQDPTPTPQEYFPQTENGSTSSGGGWTE